MGPGNEARQVFGAANSSEDTSVKMLTSKATFLAAFVLHFALVS